MGLKGMLARSRCELDPDQGLAGRLRSAINSGKGQEPKLCPAFPPLLPGRAVADRLLARLVDLFRGEQYGGPRADRSRGLYPQSYGGRRHLVRNVYDAIASDPPKA